MNHAKNASGIFPSEDSPAVSVCGWMLACVEQYRILMLWLRAWVQEVSRKLIFVVHAANSLGGKKNAKCVKDLKEKGGLGLGAGPLCCSALHLAVPVWSSLGLLFEHCT